MGMKLLAVLPATIALAACATTPTPQRSGRYTMPVGTSVRTDDGTALLGSDAAALTRLLGAPTREFREGTGRKLQFAGPACVLDAYLYPAGRTGAATVTHVDTRRPDGRDADGPTCVAQLRQQTNKR